MRTILLTLALATSGLAGVAQAQTATPPAPVPPAPPPGAMMQRVDSNHDGVVSRAEALAEAGARFDAMDANHDGQLSDAERIAYRDTMRSRWRARAGGEATPPPPPPPPPAATPAADARPPIARADYIARAAARFDRMDANHDGKLDPTEAASARGYARRGMMRPGGETPPPPPADAQ
ncbi:MULTISPECIES: hypothetical protein [unclassified Sphingomonas]|jgi:EF hand|uniref:hypothetical protein n=1 Tax=unclassified Sphingomonas TaxID=196159 RepID=UPI0013004827|nr:MULTISPECIES: hypothetical protein [unclassified Sphingomonas]